MSAAAKRALEGLEEANGPSLVNAAWALTNRGLRQEALLNAAAERASVRPEEFG